METEVAAQQATQQIKAFRQSMKDSDDEWDNVAASFSLLQVGVGLFAICDVLQPSVFYVSGKIGGALGGIGAVIGELTVARRINKAGYTGSCSVFMVTVGLGYVNVTGFDDKTKPVLYFNGLSLGITGTLSGGRFEIVNEVPTGGYSKMKCYNLKTGEPKGYLATHDNYLSMVVGRGNGANVKWLTDGDALWLDKDTRPNDRYVGLSRNSWAGWGLKGGERNPVIYNQDGSISLADTPTRKLYGPVEQSGTDWIKWTEENETNDDILRFVLEEPPKD